MKKKKKNGQHIMLTVHIDLPETRYALRCDPADLSFRDQCNLYGQHRHTIMCLYELGIRNMADYWICIERVNEMS